MEGQGQGELVEGVVDLQSRVFRSIPDHVMGAVEGENRRSPQWSSRNVSSLILTGRRRSAE